MATAQRQPASDLSRLLPLLRRAGRYGFLAVVDLLAREGGLPIRFRHEPSLGFHPGELCSVLTVELPPAHAGEPPRRAFEVTACFLGLTGSFGPVPVYLSEMTVCDDDAAGMRNALLAPFHHRLYELFHRAARRCDPPRSFVVGATDLWSRRLLAWLGVGTLQLRHIPRPALLRLAPLLVSRVRSARTLDLALREVLADLLPASATLRVVQFTGGWAPLGEGTQMQLGRRETLALGRSTVIGTGCHDPAGGLRIELGPLAGRDLAVFSPRGEGFVRIAELVGLLVRDPLEIEVDLLTDSAATAVPLGQLRLGANFRLVAPDARRRRVRFRLADGAALGPA
jgi:type VI secretion system protein ImpH